MREFIHTPAQIRYTVQDRTAPSESSLGHLAAEQEAAKRAADRLREVYRKLGVDDETIQVLYESQTSGRPEAPVTRSNVIFLQIAAEAAAEIGDTLPVINDVRKTREEIRTRYVDAFVSERATRSTNMT